MFDILEIKRKKLLGNWFYNLKNNIINEDVLFLSSSENNMKFINLVKDFIYENVNENYHEGIKYSILDFKQLKENIKLPKKNLIIIGYKSINFEIDLINLFSIKKILCYNFINKIDLDCIDTYVNKPILTLEEKNLIYINTFEPITLINEPKEKIENFVFNIYGQYSFFKETNIINLLRDTNIDKYNQKQEIANMPFLMALNEYLLRDLIILKEKKHL